MKQPITQEEVFDMVLDEIRETGQEVLEEIEQGKQDVRDMGYEQRPVGDKIKNTRTGFVEEPVTRKLDDADKNLGSNKW